ncbi:ion channel [Methanosarcina siciliae]|uniref:ion channel n=1 Tax=Methanosarcina siciliae TaxID=38027 RepID=UPI001E2F534D|nr:ion channel [Methanosarcina siciliae]
MTTLLTTGYGDTVLQTNFGRLVASVVKILGFSIIVVPIVIIIAEIFKSLSETSWKN